MSRPFGGYYQNPLRAGLGIEPAPDYPFGLVGKRPGPLAPPGPAVLLKDLFVGTANSALTAHTMDTGPGWANGGTGAFLLIGSGGAKPSGVYSTTPNCIAVANAGQAPGYGEVSFTFNDDNNGTEASLIYRYQDVNNFFLASVQRTAQALSIYERNAGTFTQRATTALTVDPATLYRLQLTLVGNLATINVGAVSTNYSSSDFASSLRWGIRVVNGSNDTNIVVSNFLVTA